MTEKIFDNIEQAKKYCENLFGIYKEVKIAPYHKTRTSLQNRALHLFFRFIAENLNEFTSFHYKGLTQDFEISYTESIVKEYIWRPLQVALFGKTSTTKLTTQDINTMIDIFNKFFSEKGINLTFPCWESYSRLAENYEKN